jgi:hypothetical protein
MPDNDASEPTFHLDLDISDPTLVEWLEELPDDQVQPRVEDTLRAGHFVLNLVQAAAGEEQMARYFQPVTSQMTRLEETLDDIMGRAKASQRIGKLGERFAVSQLTEAFPGDSFEDVSAGAEQADIRAFFDVGGDEPKEARIEVKFYTDDVPTKELKKFRRDMEKTGVKFGLMVSMASRLTGMKSPLKIEEDGGRIAVFVSRAGLDGVRLVAAAAMLKAIIIYHSRAEALQRVSATAIHQAWSRLSAEVEEIEAIARQVAQFRDSVWATADSLTEQLRALADGASDADIRLRHAVQRLTNRLHAELEALPYSGDRPALPEPSPPDAVLAELSRLKNRKDKRAAAYSRVHEQAEKHGLDIRIEDDGTWLFLKEGTEVARTAGAKNRLDLVFPPAPQGEELRLISGLEKERKEGIVVDGTDIEAFTARVGERFREAKA